MKLRDSESLYKSFFDATLDGLAYCQMIFDEQGRPTDFVHIKVNKNYEKLTGFKSPVGKRITKFIPKISTSNPEIFEIYGRVASTGKPERFETYFKQLNKSFLILVYSFQKNFFVTEFQNISSRRIIEKDLKSAEIATLNILEDLNIEKSNLENSRIAARNVLEDLNAEKSKLEMARAREETILLSIGDGLMATDVKGNIILINQMAEILLGWTRAEVMGKVFFDVLPMEDEKGIRIEVAG